MKKTFTLIVAFCAFAMFSKGQLPYDEIFNYSVSNLALEPTWHTNTTTPPLVGTGRNIITPALTYITTDGTYVLSDKGKTIKCEYTSGALDYSSFKQFTTTPVTTGALYLSFLFKAGVAQKQSNSELFGLGDSAGSGPKVWVGKGLTTGSAYYRLGITRGSGTGADVKYPAPDLSDTLATILVVFKYTFSDSTASLFINPTLGSASEPTPGVIDNVSSPTSVKSKLSSLRFRVNGNNKANFNVSSARVSSSWADAVAKASFVGLANQVQSKNSYKILQNPSTNVLNLEYNLTNNSKVNLVLHNMNGQAVKTLINNTSHSSGSYSESFDVSGLKPGIYLARVTIGGETKSSKILISR
jgi:hypothetical protein